MNLPYFLANRISVKGGGSFSALVYYVAIGGIAIGIAIMTISYLILEGFRVEIKSKVYDFTGHIHVRSFGLSNSMEEASIGNSDFWRELEEEDEIIAVYEVAHKPALLRTGEEVEGVVLKGLPHYYDTLLFSPYLKRGRFPNFKEETAGTEVLLSETLARRLQLDTGSRVNAFFFQDPPRARRLDVVGIYSTGFTDFDAGILLVDLNLIRRLNNWKPDEAGQLEIRLRSEADYDSGLDLVEDYAGFEYYVQDVRRKYLDTFDWLQIITNNVNVFLGLIMFVACFNMVAVLFILIMERTRMVGVLKALGAEDGLIRKVFLILGSKILWRGMLIGNVLGLGLAALQSGFRIIKLDPENYFMEYVPISWHIPALIWINAVTAILVLIALFLPLRRISAIEPVKSIRFD